MFSLQLNNGEERQYRRNSSCLMIIDIYYVNIFRFLCCLSYQCLAVVDFPHLHHAPSALVTYKQLFCTSVTTSCDGSWLASGCFLFPAKTWSQSQFSWIWIRHVYDMNMGCAAMWNDNNMNVLWMTIIGVSAAPYKHIGSNTKYWTLSSRFTINELNVNTVQVHLLYNYL